MINPLQAGGPFQLTLGNPSPTSSKTKDGPVYRVSFELPQEEWQLFMDAETKGMVIEVYHAEVVHSNESQASPDGAGGDNSTIPSTPVQPKEDKPKGGSLAKSVAMVCATPEFQQYIGQAKFAVSDGGSVTVRAFQGSESGAAEAVRVVCGVASRADLDHNASAKGKLNRMMEDYRAWREKMGMPV